MADPITVDTLQTIKLGLTAEALISALNTNFASVQDAIDLIPSLSSDLGDTYTKDEIDAKMASVYKPAGSKAFADLGTPTAAQLGKVYNITNGFTVTSDFVEYDATEGATQATHGPGMNVVCVDVGTAETPAYKWDVLGAFVDLSPYYTKTEADAAFVAKETGKGLSTNDFTDELKTKLDGVAANANNYVLPAAGDALGGVKNGGNVVINTSEGHEGEMSVGSKLTFTDEAASWVTNGDYKSLTLTSTAIPVAVFKAVAEGTYDEVMVGVRRTATSIIITASEPFAGYVQVI